MHKTHNSSQLSKQVAEKLHLNQEDGLRLYKELSQIPNGFVKDALDALTQDTASKKYVACIKGTCVRDAQYATHDDENRWMITAGGTRLKCRCFWVLLKQKHQCAQSRS